MINRTTDVNKKMSISILMKMKEQIEFLKDTLEEYWVKDDTRTANAITIIDEMRVEVLDAFHTTDDENKRIIKKIQKNRKRDIHRVNRKFIKLLNNHKNETDLKFENLHKEFEDFKNETYLKIENLRVEIGEFQRKKKTKAAIVDNDGFYELQDEDFIKTKKFVINGNTYLKCIDDESIYDIETEEFIGMYNVETNSIVKKR